MPLEDALLAFARALRVAGVPVDASRGRVFVSAVGLVGAANRDDVYWAGRASLCSAPTHLPIYEKVFNAWFAEISAEQAESVPEIRFPVEEEPATVASQASSLEVLRHRDVATLSAAELEAVAELFALLKPASPKRRSSRRQPGRRGELDVHRLMREEVRLLGEPAVARYRTRATRPRRTLLLLDVSGSMASYTDTLLRLAHVWVRSTPGLTEAFTIGTRLTRITPALIHPDPDQALRAAAEAVPDWSGGTRLAEGLAVYLDRWGRHRITRGATAVIFSDGWERGPAEYLGEQTARLRRSTHRLIWANPHRGRDGFRPVQSGMAAALPHCDGFVPGHSVEAFRALIAQVAAS